MSFRFLFFFCFLKDEKKKKKKTSPLPSYQQHRRGPPLPLGPVPHPQLLQGVDEGGTRQNREVREATARRVARQQLGDAAVAPCRLEQRGEIDSGEHKVQLRPRVAARQDLQDARALAGQAAADAGEGLGSREGDAAVPRDRRRRGVESGGLALGLWAAAREPAAAAAAVASSDPAETAAAPFSGAA